MSEKNRQRRNAWVICCGLLIFALFSLPGKTFEQKRTSCSLIKLILSDPLIHVYSFGLFTLMLGWRPVQDRVLSFPFVRLGLIALAYGIFIEVYQIALPYRSFQFADIFFDALGISLSLLILYIAWRTARGIDGAMSKK